LIVLDGFGLVTLPPVAMRFTSARTLEYSALLMPNDFCRAACPLPYLPARTSFAICATVFLFDVDGLGCGLGLVCGLLDCSTSTPFTRLINLCQFNPSRPCRNPVGQFLPLQ